MPKPGRNGEKDEGNGHRKGQVKSIELNKKKKKKK